MESYVDWSSTEEYEQLGLNSWVYPWTFRKLYGIEAWWRSVMLLCRARLLEGPRVGRTSKLDDHTVKKPNSEQKTGDATRCHLCIPRSPSSRLSAQETANTSAVVTCVRPEDLNRGRKKTRMWTVGPLMEVTIDVDNRDCYWSPVLSRSAFHEVHS